MGVISAQGYSGKLVAKESGLILDTFADESIKVSNNILDLFDLGQVPGTFSRTITLPGTKKNDAFFEQYYDVSVYFPDQFNTNQKVEAYLDFDAFYLLDGFMQLNKVNVRANKFIDSYEITLFGSITNFSVDTRSSFLTDISSLRAYNHTSSLTNITASWQRNLFNGDIVYPMAEYGQQIFYSQDGQFGINTTSGSLDVQDYKPAIRLKKVWDAIFDEFGYTYTGSFWNQSWLNDVYLLANNNLRTPVYQPSIETFGQGKINSVSSSLYVVLTSSASLDFTAEAIEYDYNGKFTLGTPATYTVDSVTTLDCEVKFGYSFAGYTATDTMVNFNVYFVTGSTAYTSSLTSLNTQLNTITPPTTFSTRNDSTVFKSPALPAGTYQIKYGVYSPINVSFYYQPNPNPESTSWFKVNKVNQAADNKILDLTNNMPFGTSGIRVIDFITSVQKKFNLVIYPSKVNPNQFIVESFNNWYNSGDTVDFNKYINLNEKIEVLPANQLGYRQLRFSDADDSDYIETIFKRTNNRVYGESNYYDSGSFFSQGKLEVLSNVIASGPLGLIPGSVFTGSASAVGTGICTTYEFNNPSSDNIAFLNITLCDGTPLSTTVDRNSLQNYCVLSDSYIDFYNNDGQNPVQINSLGDCSPAPTGSVSIGTAYPTYVPYYVADDKYKPARVLPRIMFYNGLVSASAYYVDAANSTNTAVQSVQLNKYPYFDNYSTGSLNGTASIFPQLNSKSLLYNNEQAVWGTTPTASLVSEYWSDYLSLLYNPRTRLLNAAAVIPLSDYFELELNDVAQFRGNYYHLRAINDYDLKTGECLVQLLGPLLQETPLTTFVTPTTSTTTTTTTAATTTTTSTTTTTTTGAATTTTTTTTTSTTTTTTTYRTQYLVELCGGGLGPYIVTRATGDTPAGIGQAFRISGNSGAGFNGTNCWTVLEIDPVGSIDYADLAFGTVFSTCEACVPTTTSTTTTTTTIAVNFGGSTGCSNGSDGQITITSFSGGGGTYQASSTTYSSETNALNGTYTDVSTLRTYTGLAVGTYWVALRDKNQTSNRIAKPFTVNACPTTTTTTQAPVTFDITGVCTGTTQTITVNNFGGGDGSTYYVSTTTYGDAGSAAIGAVTLETGGSRVFTNQPNGTRYVRVASTISGLVKGGGQTNCTTTTTTSTTTTTTTLLTYQVEVCGGGIGPYWVTRASGDIPAGIGQAFKISGNSGAGFNGTNCWEVLDSSTSQVPDYTNLAFGTVFSNCEACIPTTTTTTSTTTTTTTAAPDCECYSIFNEGGTTGNYSYQRCPDGVVVSPNILAGTIQTRCVLAGTTITINSGLLTDVQCGTPCNTSGDCSDCI